MPTTPRPTRRFRRAVAGLAVGLTAFSIATAVSAPASLADPPPNPTDGQLQTAAAQKAALATQVGSLNAQVAQMQSQLQQLQAAQEMAEQKLAYALSLLEEAKQTAITAKANVAKAQQQVTSAQQAFTAYIQAAYMSGEIQGTSGTLLTASDPSALLAKGALQSYEATNQISAIGNLQRASVAKANADAGARKAVEAQTAATDAAKKAEADAVAAVEAARQQQDALNATLASTQTKLDAAQLQLATLNNQRATYIAYQKQQAAIAAAKAEAARKAAEEAERARQEHGASGGGSSGGGSSSGGSTAPPPSGGSWSAARGQEAVNRAKRYLGWPYAWAGGNASGPTRGVCTGGGAWNDCHITGFDCSGLVLYGWAPYKYLPHFAMAQYSVAGRYHPSMSNLLPGDLVFWSSNGSVSGIHHVAMYIGGGNVIQAPQSGDIIRITGLYNVSSGLFGATRPLT